MKRLEKKYRPFVYKKIKSQSQEDNIKYFKLCLLFH